MPKSQRPESQREKPKILYIGDFTKFYATENYVSHGFESLGYEVLRVQDINAKNPKAVLGAALKYQVEFVIFSKGNYSLENDVIGFLRANGVLTVGWIFDLYFDLPTIFGKRSLTNNSFKADICFVTDGGHDKEFRQHGINSVLLRQGIHEPDAVIGQSEGEHPPIVFVGTYSYPERLKMIDWLKDYYGKKFRHYGTGGQVREQRGMKLNNIFASCKIVVGDSVPSPFYWSNRVYEVTGRGGFLMHPYVEGLEQEFQDGVHYVGFKHGDFRDLEAKINYYLKHDEEREKIRKAGFELTRTKYTYKKRCEQLLKYVEERKRKAKH